MFAVIVVSLLRICPLSCVDMCFDDIVAFCRFGCKPFNKVLKYTFVFVCFIRCVDIFVM